MSIRSRAPFRDGALVILLGLASCAVPTEPRWDRGSDGGASVVPPLPSSVERYTVEAAPVVASTEFRSRVVPATETVVVAPAAGRAVGRLVATGDAVAAGDPIMEWSTGVDDVTRLRIEILELQIELADLEGRVADATTTRGELEQVRAVADRGDTELIVSPVDGVIGRYVIDRSASFDAGDELVTVGDPRRTRVDIVVTADAAGSVVEGSTVRVIDAQNRFADASPAIVTDVRSRSETDVVISAVLPDASALPVGTRVLVDVDRRSDGSGRRLPSDAVLDDGLGPFVMVEDSTGWQRVDVEIGLVSDDFVELLTDIPVGATVVVP